LPPRASWKGFLKIAEVTCPVALYAGASTGERVALHTINRPTVHRVRRQFVDAETGDPVEPDDQLKGYEVAEGEYVSLEPDEIAIIPHGEKTLSVSAFIDLADVDDLNFDKPYYLGPADRSAEETFALRCEGMRAASVAAVAQAVLFRRVRTLLIRAYDKGLAATTLNFDYEVHSPREAFSTTPDIKINGEMLDLAIHIIKTKQGGFNPREFHDRYEGALVSLVRAKLEGKEIPERQPAQRAATVNLLQALRESAGASASSRPAASSRPRTKTSAKKGTGRSKAGPAGSRRKAG
jgi:DNA end-binding protein Ku